MRCATAVGRHVETRAAFKQAVDECLRALGPSEALTAGLVFSGVDHDPKNLAGAIADLLPDVPVVGCTTDGEISNEGLTVDSICVMLLVSPNVTARAAAVRDLSQDSGKAGMAIARRLNAENAKALILLPDGLTGNGSSIVRGAVKVLGDQFVIAGGTAGDRGRFEHTYQFAEGEALTNALVGLMFYSDRPLEVGYGVMSGWRPMGVAKRVTQAEGNTVFRIEDKTALDVYSTFLGEKASQLPAIGVEYPFAIVDEHGIVDTKGIHDGEEYILLRAPMVVHHDTGAVSFAAEIPQGSKIKMTRAKSHDVIEAAREAAQRALSFLNGPPDAAFFFSCMARKVVLGRKTNEEITAAREVFGHSVPLIGFYTYGEIANCGDRFPICRFHNETATFLLLREPEVSGNPPEGR